MHPSIKKFAANIIPRLPRPLSYYCISRVEARWTPAEEWQNSRRNRSVQASKLAELGLGLRVMSGPFAGMKYVGVACGSTLPPKLLGTYELEAHAAIEKICAREFDTLFNLGAAEGYYAVGLAMRIPRMSVITYDWWGPAHYWLRRIAFENNVMDRIETRGRCEVAEFARSLEPAKQPLVVCDVEGAEDELLDPLAAPALLRSVILVELHDMEKPGISERVRQRFETSHDILSMDSRTRTVADLPRALRNGNGQLVELMDEHRQSTQSWFLMTPRPASK